MHYVDVFDLRIIEQERFLLSSNYFLLHLQQFTDLLFIFVILSIFVALFRQ